MALHLIYIDKSNQQTDITKLSSNYSRSDNVDALGMDFKFNLVNSPYDVQMQAKLDLGGKVAFYNENSLVFFGVLTDMSKSGLYQESWTAYDYAFYLNKSEAFIQFNDIAANEAIKQLCESQSIPVGAICEMPTKVSKIYDTQSIADIIKDIIKKYTDETGNKIRLEVRENKLYLEKYENLILTATYKTATNEPSFDATKYPGDFSASYSISDMKNKILVISSKEKHAQVEATEQDEDNIKSFGLLQKIEKVQDKEKAKASQIAKTKLKELNRIKTTRKVKLFGDDAIRAGRSLVFNQPTINLVGTFLIKNCTHTYSNNNHFMELDLDAL